MGMYNIFADTLCDNEDVSKTEVEYYTLVHKKGPAVFRVLSGEVGNWW